ncbi:MAG: hypothetical protein QME81_09840 [bacterium]|nr:hypothetical protein [bacterium]
MLKLLKFAVRNGNNPKSEIRNPKSEEGMTLVVAMILMLAIIALGSAYTILTISESRRAKIDEHYIQGLPSAEGGIDHALWKLQHNSDFRAEVAKLNAGEFLSYTLLPTDYSDTVDIIVMR